MSALGPLALYRIRRRAGALQADPAQAIAAEKLESLHRALEYYEPGSGGAGWRLRLGLSRRPGTPPQGLYLFGGVGRGKSMLMDLFHGAAPGPRKRRVHFLPFMAEIHDRLHRLRGSGDSGDTLSRVAAEVAAESPLLCFDEFRVADIADAMLLDRLFRQLFESGVVVVATSNWAPDDLYKGGLQRERFLPFIDVLKERLDVLQLDGETDYRLARLRAMAVYHQPLGGQADEALLAAFRQLTDDAPGAPATLDVLGRKVAVPRAAKNVACFDFADLCERPLGASDYIAIATHFATVILANVPIIPADRLDTVARFMTLIDVLYEHKVKLIVAAAGPPEALYRGGRAAFEFERTRSRLHEMRSAEYLARPHLP
jgi:cell division protein ZapE